MREESDGIILLNDEDGEEYPFEMLDVVEYQGKEYAVLLPVADEDDGLEEQVVILELGPGQGEEQEYLSVDDEAVLQAVFDIFRKQFRDVFIFGD